MLAPFKLVSSDPSPENAPEKDVAETTAPKNEIVLEVEAGVEMLVGVVNDALFGPVVACAAGGVTVELLRDVAVRIAPLSGQDATEMLRSLATFPLLDGYRGSERADVAALEEVLLRVSALVQTHPEIAEMDCNPVMVLAHGAAIVDARVRVQSPQPTLPIAATRT